jgi:hypothetical protein
MKANLVLASTSRPLQLIASTGSIFFEGITLLGSLTHDVIVCASLPRRIAAALRRLQLSQSMESWGLPPPLKPPETTWLVTKAQTF